MSFYFQTDPNLGIPVNTGALRTIKKQDKQDKARRQWSKLDEEKNPTKYRTPNQYPLSYARGRGGRRRKWSYYPNSRGRRMTQRFMPDPQYYNPDHPRQPFNIFSSESALDSEAAYLAEMAAMQRAAMGKSYREMIKGLAEASKGNRASKAPIKLEENNRAAYVSLLHQKKRKRVAGSDVDLHTAAKGTKSKLVEPYELNTMPVEDSFASAVDSLDDQRQADEQPEEEPEEELEEDDYFSGDDDDYKEAADGELHGPTDLDDDQEDDEELADDDTNLSMSMVRQIAEEVEKESVTPVNPKRKRPAPPVPTQHTTNKELEALQRDTAATRIDLIEQNKGYEEDLKQKKKEHSKFQSFSATKDGSHSKKLQRQIQALTDSIAKNVGLIAEANETLSQFPN